MKGLLNSSHEFETQEMLLQFKFRLLNSYLLIAVFFAFLMGLLYDLGLHDTGYFHSRVNYLYSIASIFLFIWLRQSKESFKKVSKLLIVITLLTCTSALVFVTGDQFRIIWFYIAVFLAYSIMGSRAGIITTVVSITIIVLCFFVFELGLSQITLQGALIGLAISSVLINVHIRKITDLENALLNKNRELEVLATVDGLTGVMNKRMFNEMMRKYLETTHRNDKPLSFLYLDLDHFKKINDQHGHQVGDIMLIKFTDVVGKCLRKSDLLGRVGGEEFAVVLFETDSESAKRVAEKILQRVQESSYQYEQKLVKMTTSIGLSWKLSASDLQEAIQQRADKALYKAKAEGRNRVEICKQDID